MNPSLLEKLRRLHAESFGWALACSAWQRSTAEDVLQEAYLRVADGRARFAGRSSEKTWFFGVIKRVAAEQTRVQTRSRLLNLRLLGEPRDSERGDTSADSLYTNETARQLQAALLQLPARQREVLHLVFYVELTLEETAETLAISLGSVRTHYHRGKQRLAALLAGERDGN